MSCLVADLLVLNINKESDFNKNISVSPEDTVVLTGFEKEAFYSFIKEKICKILSYLSFSNILILDMRNVETVSFDESARIFGALIRKKIPIKVVASEKLHRLIKRFGVEVFTPEEFKDFNLY